MNAVVAVLVDVRSSPPKDTVLPPILVEDSTPVVVAIMLLAAAELNRS